MGGVTKNWAMQRFLPAEGGELIELGAGALVKAAAAGMAAVHQVAQLLEVRGEEIKNRT